MRHGKFVYLTVALAMAVLFPATSALAADVVARRTTQPPAIDGKVDPAWGRIRAATIAVDGKKIGKVSVSLKAMYDDNYVYFLVQWADKTMSLNRVYELRGGKWEKNKGNEDRLGILFDVGGSIADFNRKGCEAVCHNKGEYMATSKPGEKGDLWHWKAQRTNPVGYADDQWLQHVVTKEGDEKTGRKSDKKEKGGYDSNFDKAKNQPKFAGPGKGGAVLLKAGAKPLAGGAAEGTVAPREVLDRPQGSRGDVDAGGIWENGKWTVELRRKLNTGHGDDVVFVPGGTHLFGLSIFDNGDGEEHSVSKEPLRLILRK